jgi:hypothetical protein
MEEKEEKPKKTRKQPSSKRLDEQGINTLDEIFPGFGAWYRARYDEDGNLRPDARVLRLRGEP